MRQSRIPPLTPTCERGGTKDDPNGHPGRLPGATCESSRSTSCGAVMILMAIDHVCVYSGMTAETESLPTSSQVYESFFRRLVGSSSLSAGGFRRISELHDRIVFA